MLYEIFNLKFKSYVQKKKKLYDFSRFHYVNKVVNGHKSDI